MDIESIASNIAILSEGELITYSAPEQLIQTVENKVWNYVIPSTDFKDIQDKYSISNAIHRSDGVHARIVSDLRPSNSATLLPSSLEDAYLYYVSSMGVKYEGHI